MGTDQQWALPTFDAKSQGTFQMDIHCLVWVRNGHPLGNGVHIKVVLDRH